MLTKQEEILVADLKIVGTKTETIQSVLLFLDTKEKQVMMDDFLVERYRQKGEVTEQDTMKAVIMIT